MTNQTETTKPEAPTEAGGQVERVVRWMPLKQSIPTQDRIVWCLREHTPTGLTGSLAEFNGVTRREVRLAKRIVSVPPVFHEDISIDAWWHGLNENDGHSWSDSTVLAWRELDTPNGKDWRPITQQQWDDAEWKYVVCIESLNLHMGLLNEAMKSAKELLGSADQDESSEDFVGIPALAWREFVDANAAILYKLANG